MVVHTLLPIFSFSIFVQVLMSLCSAQVCSSLVLSVCQEVKSFSLNSPWHLLGILLLKTRLSYILTSSTDFRLQKLFQNSPVVSYSYSST